MFNSLDAYSPPPSPFSHSIAPGERGLCTYLCPYSSWIKVLLFNLQMLFVAPHLSATQEMHRDVANGQSPPCWLNCFAIQT